MARRSKLEIYRDILESVSERRKVTTRISDDAHLNFQRCRESIEKVKGEGLLGEEDGEYYLTGKGEKALQVFRELEGMMGNLIYKSERVRTDLEKDEKDSD